MRNLTIFLLVLLGLVGCSQGPDIQGAWYFDYEKTRLGEFPNAQYESARLLIADIEPRYGSINVEGDTLVLGGGVVTELSLFLEDGRLVVKTHGDSPVIAVFSRSKQDPYAVYGFDPNAKQVVEETPPREQVAEPAPDPALAKYVGYARTRSFNAFYDPDSVKTEGRYTTVKVILNYLEPQGEGVGMRKALSSVQLLTFDCPGSNYRLDRYVQYSELNSQGAIVSDSGVYVADKAEMKPVPLGSVNEVLYMKVCR